MQENNDQLILTIFIVVALIVFIGVVMLFIAVSYTNSKRRIIREKEIMKATYEKAILQAQFEIQEQTLRNVSQEIHDNIGQVLSYVSLSLDRAAGLKDDHKGAVITESRELVNQSMNDLRDLSKSFSLDNIAANGLSATIKTEAARLNKSRLIEVDLKTTGDIYTLGGNRELVLFRILQEFVNNTLKHSKAKRLTVELNYQPDTMIMTLQDDGVGFDPEEVERKNGSGLKNMRTRAGIIGATVLANSEAGKGAGLMISVPRIEN